MKDKFLSVVIPILAALYTAVHFLYSGVYGPFVFQQGGGDYFTHISPVREFLATGIPLRFSYYGPLHYLFALPFLYFFQLKTQIVLFYFLDIMCLAGSVYFTGKVLLQRLEFKKVCLILFLWLNSAQIYYLITMRSAEIYEIFCLSAAFYLFQKNSKVKAGLMFGTATAFKFLPGIFLPFLLIRKLWKPAAAFLIVVLSCYGVSALIFGRSFSFGNLLGLPGSLHSDIVMWWPNQSLGGVIQKFFVVFEFKTSQGGGFSLGEMYPYYRFIEYFARIVLAGFIGWLLFRKAEIRTTFRNNIEFSIILCAMILLSPIAWEHYGGFSLFAYSFAAVYLLNPEGLNKSARIILSGLFSLSFILSHYLFPKSLLNLLPALKEGLENTVAPQYYCTAAIGWLVILGILVFLHFRHLAEGAG